MLMQSAATSVEFSITWKDCKQQTIVISAVVSKFAQPYVKTYSFIKISGDI